MVERPGEHHKYQVTEITADVKDCGVGTVLVDNNHDPMEHEPHRTWEVANINTGEPTGYIVAKHVGVFGEEYPKKGEDK